ncbi:MAG: methyltransferase [Clostridia bacterium]|nr:methyltransferase [Clostridia bacterium]
MGRREDFYKIMRHEQPDNLILDLGGNPLSTMEGMSANKLLDYLGYKPESDQYPEFGKTRRIDQRIRDFLDIDTVSVGTILTPYDSLYQQVSKKEYIDEWGIKRTFDGMYWDNVHSPLKGTTIDDLKNYRWPNPDSIDFKLLESYKEQAKNYYENTDYIICGEHPVYGIFELGCWMCGFDDYLMKLIVDPDYIKYFSEKVIDYQRAITEIYYREVGPYIHFTSSGDDFATQNSMFMSVDMFDENIKPYLKERVSYTKQFTDAYFLHHSCGSVHDLIPSLIDCSVDILNPIQPTNELMKPKRLKDDFGKDIVFHGGLDTQSVLPFGNDKSIGEAVSELIQQMNIDGGYIFAAAHNIQEDVPPENVISMFKWARKLGKKK